MDGTSLSEALVGKSGNDLIFGNAGNDVIDGGTSNDQLFGGLGDDTYIVSAGDDEITVGGGNDRVSPIPDPTGGATVDGDDLRFDASVDGANYSATVLGHATETLTSVAFDFDGDGNIDQELALTDSLDASPDTENTSDHWVFIRGDIYRWASRRCSSRQ